MIVPVGLAGLARKTIRVRSVVGRYLEHSRIFSFECGGDERIYVGSADLMPRNLDTREIIASLQARFPQIVAPKAEALQQLAEKTSPAAMSRLATFTRSKRGR